MFMLYQTIQKHPIKEILDLRILDIISIEYILKLSINSSWHLIPQLAITKAGLICLVRSQQLCSGTMHTRLASKFYSYGNRSKSFRLQNKKMVSRSLVPLYHSTVRQICGAGVWLRDIQHIVMIYNVCMGSSGWNSHIGTLDLLFTIQKIKSKIQFFFTTVNYNG